MTNNINPKTNSENGSECLFRLRGAMRQARDIVRGRVHASQRKQWLERLNDADIPTIYNFVAEQIPPFQIKSELFALVKYLRQVEPQVYCEIGVANGGTSFFITRTCLSIRLVVGVDVHIKNAHIVKDMSRSDCRVSLIDGRSDWRSVRNAVKRSLRGRTIDVFLIDGDHSYDGVRNDFLLYKDLVRDGGLILFHDIVEDHGTKFGTKTIRYTGGVPQFFREISKYYEYRTFVESPGQDGFGIGSITYRTDIELSIGDSVTT